jgi:hypothetical protein
MKKIKLKLRKAAIKEAKVPHEVQTDIEEYIAWLDEQERLAAYERDHEEGK